MEPSAQDPGEYSVLTLGGSSAAAVLPDNLAALAEVSLPTSAAESADIYV